MMCAKTLVYGFNKLYSMYLCIFNYAERAYFILICAQSAIQYPCISIPWHKNMLPNRSFM